MSHVRWQRGVHLGVCLRFGVHDPVLFTEEAERLLSVSELATKGIYLFLEERHRTTGLCGLDALAPGQEMVSQVVGNRLYQLWIVSAVAYHDHLGLPVRSAHRKAALEILHRGLERSYREPDAPVPFRTGSEDELRSFHGDRASYLDFPIVALLFPGALEGSRLIDATGDLPGEMKTRFSHSLETIGCGRSSGVDRQVSENLGPQGTDRSLQAHL